MFCVTVPIMNKLLKAYRKKYELFLFDRPVVMIQESADMNTIIDNTPWSYSTTDTD